MAKGYTTRKLEVFSLHARTTDGSVDYRRLFAALAQLTVDSRQLHRDDSLVAVPELQIDEGRVFTVVYEGPLGMHPLIFDATRARERIQRLAAKEVVATRTHCLVDLVRREAIIEYNHRGAKATDLAALILNAGRSISAYATLEFDLNPKVHGSFLDAVGKFGRIRVASLRIARPNVDWTENYNSLQAVGEESGAQTISLEVTAGRGASLAKHRGIIAYIGEAVRQSLATLKAARVTGVREDETSETTVSMAHYLEHQRINVKMTDDGHVDSQDIRRHMTRFLDARAAQRTPGHRR